MATDPYKREEIFPTLTADQLNRAGVFGAVEPAPKGTVLFRRGDHSVDFFICLKGNIEIYDDTGEVVTVHHENQFTGELDLFNDRNILVSGRLGADGEIVRLSRPQFRRMLQAEPDIAEIIMRAFILRRMGFLEHDQAGVTLIGSNREHTTLRLQRFLERNAYPVRVLKRDDPRVKDLLGVASVKADDTVVVCSRDRVLTNPTNRELADCLGIAERIDPILYDTVVVGGGPSGLAAAVYAASEGLKTVVIEVEAPGGQAGTSSKIENYLGFPVGISGEALAGRAMVQAQKFGARIVVSRSATHLHCDNQPLEVELEDGERVRGRTVVISTGARYRKLDVDGMERFEGSGIHYAATQIEAGVCQSEEIIVVGGGNSAGQAAVFLSRHAKHVYMLVRGKELASSMSEYLIDRINASKTVTLCFETEITGLFGDRHLESVRWRDAKGIESDHAIANVFLMLGAVPNTEWLGGCVEVDANGFVCTGQRAGAPLETSRRAVFAVGDVRAGSIKRVASGVGEGSMVVAHVHRALAEMRGNQ